MRPAGTSGKVIIVISTAPDKKCAENLARALLTARLCACVNIIPGVHSLFHWQGKIDSAEEYMLLVKTRKELYKDVERMIRSKHPYSVPEIIASTIEHVHSDYLTWLLKETRR